MKREKSLFSYIYIFLASFIPLLLCSKCSFIYPFNDWYDINILFTIGKGMMTGKIPYVDFIDHKGPYCYLLTGLAYKFSHTTFAGIFIVEVICMFLFLLLINDTIKLYSDKNYFGLFPFVSFSIVSSRGFVHGGSMEELSLPILMFALYTLIRYIRKNEISYPVILLNGFLAGVLFWSKFTLVGLFLAWVILFAVFYIINKKYSELLKSAIIFLIGFIIATLPWIIYFTFKNSLNDFLGIYLINNIFGYTNEAKLSLNDKFELIIKCALKFYKTKGNLLITLPVFLGILGLVIFPSKKISLKERITALITFAITNLGIFYSGHAHDYYGLVSALFLVYFCILTVLIADKFKDKKLIDKFTNKPYIFAIVFVIGIVISLFISDNVYLIKYHKKDLPQYRFAKIISESDDKSILNYAFMDCGIYTVLDTVPEIREYCTTNLDYYGLVAKQQKFVDNKTTKYVITWNESPLNQDEVLNVYSNISNNYEIIELCHMVNEGSARTYTLWQRK